MQFEIHITVDSEDFNKWKDVCEKLGLNPLWIQNSKGKHSRQMLCAVDYSGSFLGVNNQVRELSADIRSAGFKVIRQKIECGFRKWPSSLYNECHIKIILPESENEAVLSFCDVEGISPSWSLIHGIPGERKWYLTVRDFNLDSGVALGKFQKAIKAFQERFGRVRGVEVETAIFDTNKDLDRGWA
jgi:hypothetical protein